MSLGYLLRPLADQDIDRIADDLIERGNLDVGLQFLATALATFALIATQPEMGWRCRLKGPELRSARVFRISEPFGKCLVFYLPTPGKIETFRVLHGAQDQTS